MKNQSLVLEAKYDRRETKLLNDGVHKDIVKGKTYYKCCLCMTEFSEQILPVLLECGHLLCQECSNEKRCPEDKNLIKIKENPYRGLLEVFKDELSESQQIKEYKFIIRDFDGMDSYIETVVGTTTFRELLLKQENFRRFVQDTGGRGIALTIDHKAFLYERIKEKKVHDFLVENHLGRNLRPGKGIEISFNDRQKGGQ